MRRFLFDWFDGSYKEWLRTPQACLLRAESRERDGHRCVRCQGTECLEMHHVLGYRRSWADTRLEDVITLCDDCHEIMHGAKDVKFLLPVAQSEARWEWVRRIVLKCGGVLRPEVVSELAGPRNGNVVQMPKPKKYIGGAHPSNSKPKRDYQAAAHRKPRRKNLFGEWVQE
jgi:hypothetical protein